MACMSPPGGHKSDKQNSNIKVYQANRTSIVPKNIKRFQAHNPQHTWFVHKQGSNIKIYQAKSYSIVPNHQSVKPCTSCNLHVNSSIRRLIESVLRREGCVQKRVFDCPSNSIFESNKCKLIFGNLCINVKLFWGLSFKFKEPWAPHKPKKWAEKKSIGLASQERKCAKQEAQENAKNAIRRGGDCVAPKVPKFLKAF